VIRHIAEFHKGVRTFTFVLLCALLLSTLGSFASAARADGSSAQATPTVGLRDGQGIQVTWSGFDPQGFVVIRQCESGATQLSQCSDDTAAITEQSSDSGTGLAYYFVMATEGTSNTNLPGAPNTQCGQSHPCQLVVSTQDTSTDLSQGIIIPITFLPEASSCPTEGVNNITGSGSGALFTVMPYWQIPLCQSASRTVINYVSSRGDVGGIQDFSCGLVDFAITEISSEEGTKCPATGERREAVYVPVANSALVFAYLMRNRFDFQRLPEVDLTPGMLAQAYSGQASKWGSFDSSDEINRNIFNFNNPTSPRVINASGDGTTVTITAKSDVNLGDRISVSAANPSCYNSSYVVKTATWLDESDHSQGQTLTASGRCKFRYVSGGLINARRLPPSTINIFGRADASGLNDLMSRFFLNRAASEFHAAGDQFSEQNFSAPSVYFPISPNISNSNFKSNQAAVVNTMIGYATTDQTGEQGFLAPMDAATAKYYSFPTVSINSVDGSQNVIATTDSISAGISEMTTDKASGVASANVSPTHQNAYPLVFTVYALIPTHPESKDSFSGIKAMLEFIRDHSSQSDLPSGNVALTSSQKQQITEGISKLADPTVPSASPSASPSQSITSTPSPIATSTPSPIATSTPLPVDSFLPLPTGSDTGSGTTGTGGSTNEQPRSNVAFPSVFAFPYVPHSGAAAGVLPAMLLVGAAGSVTGLLRRRYGKIGSK